jgi:hypothetical protein
MPEMKTVSSSHVWQLGYDEEAAELHVRFQPTVKNPAGEVVIYQGVDPQTYERVASSDSIGRALHQFVKGVFEIK